MVSSFGGVVVVVEQPPQLRVGVCVVVSVGCGAVVVVVFCWGGAVVGSLVALVVNVLLLSRLVIVAFARALVVALICSCALVGVVINFAVIFGCAVGVVSLLS